MWVWLVPVSLFGTLFVLFGLFVFLGRFRGGALMRPIIEKLSKIGFMRRFFTRMSTAALERQNPELAGAIRKLNVVAGNPNPQAMQKAMSRLTPAERRAYMEASAEQGAAPESGANRQMRRRVEKMQQQSRGSSGGSSSTARPGASGRKRKRK